MWLTGTLMRIGYVCRDLSSDGLTGSGAELSARVRVAVDAGPGPVDVPLAPARPDHRYLTATLEYADRVYDTLRSLALEVVEFVDGGGEAFTTVRAKRL